MPDSTIDLAPVAPPRTSSSSRRRSIGVFVVLAAAILALLSQGLLHSLNYFETVDQVLAQRAKIATSTIRLEGVVKPHTIHRTSYGASFWVTGSGTNEVFVVSRGTPPQLFQANIPVVVVGHFRSRSSLTFEGTQIMVKHSASYIAQYPSRVKAPNGSVR
ncbi:MAG: cytochrome c maturation protein CcmE [Acidimicrobiaceae bacterium]|nr:cytochrome c maturation protein CcmE [Acidimicrobiaceae bacterium]